MDAAPYFGVVDIGNSGLKAALVDANSKQLVSAVESLHWVFPEANGKLPPKEFQSSGAMWAAIEDQTAYAGLIAQLKNQLPNSQLAIVWKVSCVQPRALATFTNCLTDQWSIDQVQNISHSDIPMKLDVDAPDGVGIDRLLAAWWAWQSNHRRGPLIVLQAGSAVTVDWVNEQGVYCGGAIMPGLSLTLKYLAFGTAYLPWLAPPSDPRSIALPGKNTTDAILAGVTASFMGGIELLLRRYTDQYPGDSNDIQTIVSGGDGQTLARAIITPFKLVDHLVLNALAQL
ncbi:MAG: type III pantothenate kinase [Pirellulaceae bacterium]|nr:type III pantothenate kinase [Pirellulaceae bacterium]